MTDPMMSYVNLKNMSESYRAQIEELKRKVQQLELAQIQRDQAWKIIDRIEAFFSDGHYQERQEWESD